MKIILSNEWHTVLRFDRDDDVIAGIVNFAKQENITAGWLSAIGASKEIELGYFDVNSKKYINKTIQKDLELANASGTLGIKDGEPIMHLHGVFGDKDYQTIGGHIHRLIVGVTIEVFIHKIPGTLNRQQDDTFGLNLLI